MRRIAITGTLLVVLVSVGAAYAAGGFNAYTATAAFLPRQAGSSAKPSPFAMHQIWTAKGNSGNEAGPLTRIVAKIYGVVGDGKDFPVCTAKMINNAGSRDGSWNKVCPAGSLVGQGPVQSLFVPASRPSGPGAACNPYLYVYNGGQGVQVDFFTEFPFAPGPQYTCAGGAVKTGSAAAYNVSLKRQGGYLVADARLPANISTSAGGLTGVYASLIKYDLTFRKLTRKVKGKTVAYAASIACKQGRRPYSFTFVAQDYQGQSPGTQTTTVSHTSKC